MLSWEDHLATVPLCADPLAILHPYVSARDVRLGKAFLSAALVLKLASVSLLEQASPRAVSMLEQASRVMLEAC